MQRLTTIICICVVIYSTHLLMEIEPGFKRDVEKLKGIVTKDIEEFGEKVADTYYDSRQAIDEDYVVPIKPEPIKREMYSFYSWQGEVESYEGSVSDIVAHVINRAMLLGRELTGDLCLTDEQGKYLREQLRIIYKTWAMIKLPKDSDTATDEEIHSAYLWRDSEMNKLFEPYPCVEYEIFNPIKRHY